MKTACLILLLYASLIEAAKILAVLHMTSYSHYNPPNTLLIELAKRGHQVTVVSPFSPGEVIPNYRNITFQPTQGLITEPTKSLFETLSGPAWIGIYLMPAIGVDLTRSLIESKEVKELLASNETFDLVINYQFCSDALRGFCHHYKAPCILYSALSSITYVDPVVGNPTSLSYVTEFFSRLPVEMNLYERILNIIYYIWNELYTHYIVLPKHDEIIAKNFPNPEKLENLRSNISLVLLNTHISITPAKPLQPNVVEIGGYHIKLPKKLPENLQMYLDNSPEGVVYFSMGSMLKSKDIPEDKLNGILKALGKLKVKVLWKFEKDLENKPKNVKIISWAPQQSILAHPNIKVFITHGGIFSLAESIYNGVPFIGIPVYGDQINNLLVAESRGYAIRINYFNLNEEILFNALDKILNNKSYAENARIYSALMKDQPMTPLDKAMYWIEYVIRHKGIPQYKSPVLKLRWYENLLLDAIIVILIAITIFIYIIYKIVIIITRKMFKPRKPKSKLN